MPHHLSLDAPLVDEGAARAALGLDPGDFVIATFGFMTPAKRPAVLLRAFARLRLELPRARLLIVGEVSRHFDFERVFSAELRQGVTVTGRTELDASFSTCRRATWR